MSIVITVPSEPSFSAGTRLYPLTGCEGLGGAAGCPVSCHSHPALLLPQPRWPAQHWGPRGNPHSCPSTFPTHSSSWGHDQRLAPHYCQAQKNRREMEWEGDIIEWEGDIIDFKEDPDAGALIRSSTRFRFTFGNGINLLLNWQNEDSLLTFSWQCSLIAIILLGKEIQPLLLSRARLPWASGLPAPGAMPGCSPASWTIPSLADNTRLPTCAVCSLCRNTPSKTKLLAGKTIPLKCDWHVSESEH